MKRRITIKAVWHTVEEVGRVARIVRLVEDMRTVVVVNLREVEHTAVVEHIVVAVQAEHRHTAAVAVVGEEAACTVVDCTLDSTTESNRWAQRFAAVEEGVPEQVRLARWQVDTQRRIESPTVRFVENLRQIKEERKERKKTWIGIGGMTSTRRRITTSGVNGISQSSSTWNVACTNCPRVVAGCTEVSTLRWTILQIPYT